MSKTDSDGESSRTVVREKLRLGEPTPTTDVFRLDPEFIRLAERLYSYPWERRSLSEKDRTLILVAMDAEVSQLNPDGLKSSIRRAYDEGATRDEIFSVLQITSLIGNHSVSTAAPVLYEVLRERGLVSDQLSPEARSAAARFETSGPRPRPLSEIYRAMLVTDVEHFRRMQEYVNLSFTRTDVLDARMMHLICIAINAAPTHLYVEGLRTHIREALNNGATTAEIVEVIQLASITGLRTLEVALPLLDPDRSP